MTDRVINELMGKDASARFRFIMERAKKRRNWMYELADNWRDREDACMLVLILLDPGGIGLGAAVHCAASVQSPPSGSFTRS